jgi:hypothetical protein
MFVVNTFSEGAVNVGVRLRTRRWPVAVLAVATFLLFVAIGQVDGVLKDMHPRDGTSYGFSDLSGTPLSFDSSRPAKVLMQWSAYDTDPRTRHEFASSHSVVNRYVVVDAAFMVAYSVLLLALILRWRPPDAQQGERVKLLRSTSSRAAWAVLALFIVDVIEDALGWLAVRGDWLGTGAYWAAVLATTVKWLLVILLVAYIVSLWAARGYGGDTRLALRCMAAPIGLLVAYALLLFRQEQTVDLIRRWTEHWSELAAALASAVWMAVLLVAVGRQSAVRAAAAQTRSVSLTAFWVAAVLLVAAGGLGNAPGLYVPGAALVAVALTEWALRSHVSPRTSIPGRLTGAATAKRNTGAALGTIALTLLAGGMVNAATADVVLDANPESVEAILAALAVGAVAVAVWLVFSASGGVSESLVPGMTVVLGSAAGAVVVVLAAWVLNPIVIDSAIGTVAVVQLFFVVVLTLLYGATWVRESYVPPRALLLVGITRIPVFLILAAWFLIAAKINDDRHHNVRILTAAESTPARGSSIQEDFARWTTTLPPPPDDGSQRAMPLVLVAAEGGGIRAAYWTSIVMDCLFSRSPTMDGCGGGRSDRRRFLFLGSGASGGSVGLASYSAWSIDSSNGDAPALRDEMSRDFVAPTVAQALFVDLPQGFTASDWGDDRNAVLERDWEDAAGNRTIRRGIFSLQLDHPLLLLNGTDVQDGCRMNVSTLHAAIGSDWNGSDSSSSATGWEVGACEALGTQQSPVPSFWALTATDDVADYLCPNQDLALSTAAFLSARFPWVSPHGRLPACQPTGQATTAEVVDGGYLDNSGASPIVELWPRISALIDEFNGSPGAGGRCLVPVFVQIDNHYARTVRPDPNKRTFQALGPLTALFGVRDAHDSEARQAAEGLFQATGWVSIHPLAHPGPGAPLGWALSGRSMDDLEDELVDQNRDAIDEVNSWFDGGLACPGSTSG